MRYLPELSFLKIASILFAIAVASSFIFKHQETAPPSHDFSVPEITNLVAVEEQSATETCELENCPAPSIYSIDENL